MSPIDLRHMRHALALAEERNFGRAAERVGISQPTLSRSIQALEEEFGALLFDRFPREVVPTEVGRVFLHHAAPIVADADDLEREMAAQLGLESGVLRVAVGPYVAAVLLGAILGRFSDRHPALRIEVAEVPGARMREVIGSGSVELLVGEQALFRDDNEFLLEPLRPRFGEYVCRAGHPLLNRDSISVHDIMSYPLATTDISPEAWVRILGEEAGEFDPVVLADRAWKVRCQSLVAIAELVASSDAIGLFSRAMIRRELKEGTLTVIPFEGTKPSADWGIIRRRGRTLSPAAEAFVEVVRESDSEVAVD
ncbi:MAG: LysR family transcriptional regulator [marine benthic group bacterium]|jgi:DNA-binding transcriptional LysR family regulator|nr:LysR family transcriptional regulator [Candidatus Carthagonibacter metallireducens]